MVNQPTSGRLQCTDHTFPIQSLGEKLSLGDVNTY